MRLLIVADEPPWPTNSGGRTVVAREISALRTAGHSVDLLLYKHADEPVTVPEDIAAQARIVEVCRTPPARATARHPLLPYQISSRPSVKLRPVDAPPYDRVICHHEWTLPVGRAAELRQRAHTGRAAPVVLRSHNDEILYYDSLRRGKTDLAKRIYLQLEAARVTRRLQSRLAAMADEIWLITEGDASAYVTVDVPLRVVPPILVTNGADGPPPLHSLENPGNLVFVGALDPPHAVAGLEWFLASVWPRILSCLPSARFIVGGRRAGARISQLVGRTTNADFLSEVDSVEATLRLGRVFVNPVFAGSGINIKMSDPARMGMPVVTTPVGARGLPSGRGTVVAHDASGFAKACTQLLTDPASWLVASAAAARSLDGYTAERFLQSAGLAAT